MSEVSDFLDRVYKYSEKADFAAAEAYIHSKIEFMNDIGKFDTIDSILYGMDLNKIRGKIAKIMIYKINHCADKLMMGKDFMSRCIDHFGKGGLA
jgi:hypothetical protein